MARSASVRLPDAASRRRPSARRPAGLVPLGAWLALALACAQPAAHENELVVTATAYNSLPGQTEGEPDLAAWGDRLRPGMRAIAVSPDLIDLGLGRGTRVRIEGLPGEWQVLDKMNPRFRRRIDVYMGRDREAAVTFGKRKVRITWGSEDGSDAGG